MDRIIGNFCKQCEICVKNKSKTRRQIGFMSKLGPAKRPFEIMSFDTVAGVSNNNSPKKYMHILIDHFSRAVFMSTSKTQRSEDVIKLISSTRETDSIRIILAERYPVITSKEVQDYIREKDIRLIFTSTDCPTSNGQVNQTLVNRIRCKINSNKKRNGTKAADEYVDEYNNTRHSVTGFSPNHLLHGKVIEIVPKGLIENRINLEGGREKAFQNSMTNFIINKQRYDTTRRGHEFKIDDMVLVHSGNKLNRNKLDKIRKGSLKF